MKCLGRVVAHPADANLGRLVADERGYELELDDQCPRGSIYSAPIRPTGSSKLRIRTSRVFGTPDAPSESLIGRQLTPRHAAPPLPMVPFSDSLGPFMVGAKDGSFYLRPGSLARQVHSDWRDLKLAGLADNQACPCSGCRDSGRFGRPLPRPNIAAQPWDIKAA